MKSLMRTQVCFQVLLILLFGPPIIIWTVYNSYQSGHLQTDLSPIENQVQNFKVFRNTFPNNDTESEPGLAEPSSPQPLHLEEHKTRWKDHETAPFTISACLLVKDDNKVLPEWLSVTTMKFCHSNI